MEKEAKARIKINKLLEQAGWRFFADNNGPASIKLESHVRQAKNPGEKAKGSSKKHTRI